MKVLIIGGAGYVGSTLTRSLWEEGHEVTVLDRMLFGGESLVPLLGRSRFRLVRGDIRTEADLRQVVAGHDAVCLLAAIVGEPACNRDPETTVATNLQGARNALKVSRDAGVERFVFASTCSNYGVSEHDSLATERSPLRPLSTYAETKVTAEQEILAAAGPSFHPSVLRLSTAFGISARMRFDLLVSDFTLAAFRERKVVIYGEQFWRPFVHVADIAEAFRRVLTADPRHVSGEVFNVGSNEANVQKIRLGEMVQRHLPGTEIEFVQRNEDPRSYRVDFTKITERLGFRARYSVDDGIRELHAALESGVWPDPAHRRYYN